jgi:hypothetical protein
MLLPIPGPHGAAPPVPTTLPREYDDRSNIVADTTTTYSLGCHHSYWHSLGQPRLGHRCP